MKNRELAELIYVDLNIKGADLGNASIGIIEKTLNECKVKNLTIPVVSNNEVALFCGVTDGYCPHEYGKRQCNFKHTCVNQLTKL